MHFAQTRSNSEILFYQQAWPDFGCAVAVHCIVGNRSRGGLLGSILGFLPNHYRSRIFFLIILHTADFACVYPRQTTYYTSAKSVHTARIVCGFENSHSFTILKNRGVRLCYTPTTQSLPPTSQV